VVFTFTWIRYKSKTSSKYKVSGNNTRNWFWKCKTSKKTFIW